MATKGHVLVPHAIGTPKEGGHAGVRRFSALDINADPSLKEKYDFHCPDCGPNVLVHHVRQSAPYLVGDRGKEIERATHFALNQGQRHTNIDCPAWEQNLDAMQREGKPIRKSADKWIITLGERLVLGQKDETRDIVQAQASFTDVTRQTARLSARDMARLEAILFEIHPDFSSPIFDKVEIRIGNDRIPVRDIWFNSLSNTNRTYDPARLPRADRPSMLRVVMEDGVRQNSSYSYVRGMAEQIEIDGKKYTVQPEIRTNDPAILEGLMKAERLPIPAVRIQTNLDEWRHPFYLVAGEIEHRKIGEKDVIAIPFTVNDPAHFCFANASRNERGFRQRDVQMDLFK